MAEYLHPLAAPFRLNGERDDTVVLFHGWTGSPAHMRPLGAALNDAGFNVVGPLLAGHGTTPEDMAKTGWRDWMRSATEAVLHATAEGKRVHLAGLSMGGLISLLLAPVVDAASVATINAPQVVWDRRARIARLYRGSERIDRRDPPTPVPEEMQEYSQDYTGTPVGTIAELWDLIDAARRNLDNVTCPALVIQSRTDETVRPRSGEIIFDGLGSAQKGLVWLERSRHVAVLDVERDTITESILDHLHAAAGDDPA